MICKCGEADPSKFYPNVPSSCMECRKASARASGRANGWGPSEKFLLKAEGKRRCRKCNEVKADLPEFFMTMKGKTTSPCLACASAMKKAAYVPHPRVWPTPDPEVVKAKKRNKKHARRAREYGAVVRDFTADQWLSLKVTYGDRCAYCLEVKPLTQDHLLPLVRGGDHTMDNIVPACQSCNSRKGERPIWTMLTSAFSGGTAVSNGR